MKDNTPTPKTAKELKVIAWLKERYPSMDLGTETAESVINTLAHPTIYEQELDKYLIGEASPEFTKEIDSGYREFLSKLENPEPLSPEDKASVARILAQVKETIDQLYPNAEKHDAELDI